MPIPFLGQVYYEGTESVPFLQTAIKVAPWLACTYVLKLYFNGTFNDEARVMHGKVVMVTVRQHI